MTTAASILPERTTQAPLVVPFDHAANADGGVISKLFWKPRKPFIVDRVQYINPTGLAEHASNWALLSIMKTLVYADRDVASVDFGTDNDLEFTEKHGLFTGDGPVRLTTTGGAPAGLATGVDYYVIRSTDYNVKLATTRANALVGTAINITDAGTGVHTVIDQATSKRVLAYWSTDSDLAGTNTIPANAFMDLTLNNSGALVIDPSETVDVTTDEAGTTTLPLGYGNLEGRYLS